MSPQVTLHSSRFSLDRRTKKQLEELVRREKEKQAEARFNLSDFCFDKQLAFIKDPAKFKTACCSRRAGKSVACAADLFDTALSNPGTNSLYLTLTKPSAKRIIWKELLKLRDKYCRKARVNNVELIMEFPNGATIYVSGAKDESEIDKYRGMALIKCYIDEAQSFKSYLKDLIEDVLEPALLDYDGSLSLIGTPNASCAGIFYDSCHPNDSIIDDGFDWSNHAWTMHDNPWIKKKSGIDPEEAIRRIAARRRVSTADPSIQREFYGKWVYDPDSLIYKYDPKKNLYRTLPRRDDDTEYKWEYILGVDIGWQDADAYAVLAFSYEHPEVFLVEEIVQDKQDVTSIAETVKDLETRYSFVKRVMDAGALGKKIQEELRLRHSLNLEAAEKHRKYEYIELMNGDLRAGRLKVRPDARVLEDWPKMEWDRSNPDKWKAVGVHSDIADAILYAWREAHHYAYRESVNKPGRDSDEFMDQFEKQEAEKMARRGEDAWWEEGFNFEKDTF